MKYRDKNGSLHDFAIIKGESAYQSYLLSNPTEPLTEEEFYHKLGKFATTDDIAKQEEALADVNGKIYSIEDEIEEIKEKLNSPSEGGVIEIYTGSYILDYYTDEEIDEVHCTSLTVAKDSYDLTELTTIDLGVVVKPSNTTDAITYVSSDDTVATVSNGKVNILKAGTTTIYINCGSFEKTVVIKVTLNSSGDDTPPSEQPSTAEIATLIQDFIRDENKWVRGWVSGGKVVANESRVITDVPNDNPIAVAYGKTYVFTSDYQLDDFRMWHKFFKTLANDYRISDFVQPVTGRNDDGTFYAKFTPAKQTGGDYENYPSGVGFGFVGLYQEWFKDIVVTIEE